MGACNECSYNGCADIECTCNEYGRKDCYHNSASLLLTLLELLAQTMQ